MVRLRYSKRKTAIILLAVVLAFVAFAIAATVLLRPSKTDYQAANKQADVVATQYNALKTSFTTDFLNTDAADATALAPVQKQVTDLRSAADKLGDMKAIKLDSKLSADYKTFRPKLDNTLNATQDLIDGKEFMQAKVYPICGNSKDFKLTSNDVAGQLAKCRKLLDTLNVASVKSSDIRTNIIQYRANLKSVQQLSEANNPVGTAFAILQTIQSKRGATDYAAYVDKQQVPPAFNVLSKYLEAKGTNT